MSNITWDLDIDWDGSGTFTGTGADVTSRSLDDRGISIGYGRDTARALAPPGPGEMDFALNNSSRDYSPDNTSSPLAANLAPGREVRFRGTHLGTTYDLFRGYLDDYQLDPTQQEASFTAVDILGLFRNITLTTGVYQTIRTGEAIAKVLDAARWPGSRRDLDYGASILPWWWEEGTDAFTALTKLMAAEGPPALLTVSPDGSVVFRDRHHRFTRAASLTSQATLKDSGTDTSGSVVVSMPMTYNIGWRDTINYVSVDVPTRRQGAQAVVWSSDDTYQLETGETRVVKIVANDPFINAITPQPDTDYTLLSGDVGMWLSRDHGQGLNIYIRADGAPATILGLQLRADPITTVSTTNVTVEDPSLSSTNVRRDYTGSLTTGRNDYSGGIPFVHVHDARAIANLILAQRAKRLPTVSAVLDGGNSDTVLVQQLTRDLSDRVTITETQTGVNSDFYIERIEHEITEAGGRLTTTFHCEKIPTQVTPAFTFDVSGAGFNDGKFGDSGVVQPTLLFRFDTAGQGFDQGYLGI